MGAIPQKVISACKQKLLEKKTEILQRVQDNKKEFSAMDKSGGDEADQTMDLLAENQFLANQERMRNLLLEIESALARIDGGTFGVCEETEEMIEPQRLLAMPWTRLSIEGAEIRESIKKRFAR